MKPLYMWAGGKTKMLPKYRQTPGIPYTGYDTFIEPFFGGGAMMIHLAEHAPTIKKYVINDINTEIVGLYHAIKNDLGSFMSECDVYCEKYLSLTKPDRKKFYYDVRDQYITVYNNWTPTKESATLYFLMKTSFNGIFQTTKKANGRFATPAGLLNQQTNVYDKHNVTEWNAFLQKVEIYSGDWSEALQHADGKTFYFFDPPYRASFTQYGQDFTDAKTLKLIEACKTLDAAGHYVMFCNRDADDSFYTDNKGNLDVAYYDVTYTAGRRATSSDGTKTATKATEILLFSKNLQLHHSKRQQTINEFM